MKRNILVLAAATSILALVSCGDTANQDATNVLTQAQQDSILNARLEEEKARITDSINNENLRLADSVRVADSLLNAGKNIGQKVVTQSAPKKTTTPPKTNTTPNKNNSIDNSSTSVQKSQDVKFESRSSSEKKISEQKAKEQDDKFNRR